MIYSHKINTTLGIFSWQWHKTGNDINPSKKDKKGWWIAGRFEEPEKAKVKYNCNPYSGKCNFHGLYNHKDYCILSPLDQLMEHLESLKQMDLIIK